MNELLLSLGSALVGILATLWVGRYYFRQTVSKCLTPYTQFASSVFRGLDNSLRDTLKISYKGTPVDDLLEIQFLIANTGVRAIRDIIAPLTLTIPASCKLLDAAVIYVSPSGRAVKAQAETGKVVLDFALLNSDEFFILKVLLQGQAKPKDFQFTITVDDLPPILEPQPMPPDLLSDDKHRKFESPMLIVGTVLLLIGTAVAALIHHAWPIVQTLWQIGVWKGLKDNACVISGAFVCGILSVLLLVVGVMLTIGSFVNFSIPKRKRFIVPSELAKTWFRHDRIRIYPYE